MVYNVGLMTINEIDRMCETHECENCPLRMNAEDYIVIGTPRDSSKNYTFTCQATYRTFKRMYGSHLVRVNTGFKKIVFEERETHEAF